MSDGDEVVQTIEDAQHGDFIWTWKSNARNERVSIWVPYFDSVEKRKKPAGWVARYNGGSILLDLSRIDLIMFYGACGSLPLEFLDDLARNRIPLMVHRRNIPDPYVFYPPARSDETDVLTRQILFRENVIKSTYISRCLIRERFNAMGNLLPAAEHHCMRLNKARTVTEVRTVEAVATARFWPGWFDTLGVDATRRGDHPVNKALDAGSKFLFGILLRWILFHKLSPCHGYLHEPSSYTSLPYDLMEPYRYIIEKSAARAWGACEGKARKDLVAATLAEMKTMLNEVVYVPATRQMVRRKNLLHGAVLALRTYLLGNTPRLVLPVEGEKKGGRPPNCGYSLPGDATPRR